MTDPLKPPPRKDPQARTPSPLMPPTPRSRAALRLSAAAARGLLHLQHCEDCATISYPPRDACASCLSTRLVWRETSGAGQLMAETTIRTTTDPYFRERTPWRVGTVQLDAGPVLTAHLHGDVGPRARVRARSYLDRSGNGALMALPEQETPHMEDDPLLRELTAHPKHRRVLITDARTSLGQATARALSSAGASEIFLGVAKPWLPFDGQSALVALGEVVPLDLTDDVSVRTLAGTLGGKTDIVINTADHVRPGGALSQPQDVSRDAFEIGVFGLQRLARHFGPAMLARGDDGTRSAVALVDVLSVYGLANWSAYGMHSAASAARHSLVQSLRAELRPGGLRVMAVFRGPLDDDWHQPLPPPKVSPEAVARAVVEALVHGTEESFVGDIAKDVFARWQDDPKVLERELSP